MAILEIAKNFLGVIVAVVVFMIFLRLLKRHRPESVKVEFLEDTGEVNLGFMNAKDSRVKPTAELINDLIQQKPENISIALKNWVSSQNKG